MIMKFINWFRGWLETKYLCSIPGMKESILKSDEESIDNRSNKLPW